MYLRTFSLLLLLFITLTYASYEGNKELNAKT